MKYEVLNRWSGKVAFTAEIDCADDASTGLKLGLAVQWARRRGTNLAGTKLAGTKLAGANLAGTNLAGAYLMGTDLAGANLAGTNLAGAYLMGANLAGTNLMGTDLAGANLAGTNLAGAKGIPPERVQPLLMLLDQPGKIRAYKLVTADSLSPMMSTGRIKYAVGQSYSVDGANCDPAEECGAGINVATLDWCLKNWEPGWRVLAMEFEAADIACIPTASDGKFRLHRCDVVAEKIIDPVALGLVKASEPEAA